MDFRELFPTNFILNVHQIVISLVATGACGLICVLTNIPLLQNAAFITLMLSCVAPNIVNAATVEVYPTALRYVCPNVY